MPVTEYEHLENTEIAFKDLIRMLERANVDGKAVMTDELKVKIEEIYY